MAFPKKTRTRKLTIKIRWSVRQKYELSGNETSRAFFTSSFCLGLSPSSLKPQAKILFYCQISTWKSPEHKKEKLISQNMHAKNSLGFSWDGRTPSKREKDEWMREKHFSIFPGFGGRKLYPCLTLCLCRAENISISFVSRGSRHVHLPRETKKVGNNLNTFSGKRRACEGKKKEWRESILKKIFCEEKIAHAIFITGKGQRGILGPLQKYFILFSVNAYRWKGKISKGCAEIHGGLFWIEYFLET